MATLAAYSFGLVKHLFSVVGGTAIQPRRGMPDFNPFDTDFDGDVDGIDLLGFDYSLRSVLGTSLMRVTQDAARRR